MTPEEAAADFRSRLDSSLEPAHAAALDALVGSLTGLTPMISVFRRFRETNMPPDGGRAGAIPVVAAATVDGVSWSTLPAVEGTFRKRLGPPSLGFDKYSGFDCVTSNPAEVLFEGGVAGDITFGTQRSVTTSEGEYMRALQFTIACSQLGYGGRARASDRMPPTADDIERARAALGL